MPGHSTTVFTTLCAAANARTARHQTQENFTWTWPHKIFRGPQVLAWLHFHARSLHGMTAYCNVRTIRCATYLPSQMLFVLQQRLHKSYLLWECAYAMELSKETLKWTTKTTNYRTAVRKWGQIGKQRIRPTSRNWATKLSFQKERAPFRRQKTRLKRDQKASSELLQVLATTLGMPKAGKCNACFAQQLYNLLSSIRRCRGQWNSQLEHQKLNTLQRFTEHTTKENAHLTVNNFFFVSRKNTFVYRI